MPLRKIAGRPARQGSIRRAWDDAWSLWDSRAVRLGNAVWAIVLIAIGILGPVKTFLIALAGFLAFWIAAFLVSAAAAPFRQRNEARDILDAVGLAKNDKAAINSLLVKLQGHYEKARHKWVSQFRGSMTTGAHNKLTASWEQWKAEVCKDLESANRPDFIERFGTPDERPSGIGWRAFSEVHVSRLEKMIDDLRSELRS